MSEKDLDTLWRGLINNPKHQIFLSEVALEHIRLTLNFLNEKNSISAEDYASYIKFLTTINTGDITEAAAVFYCRFRSPYAPNSVDLFRLHQILRGFRKNVKSDIESIQHARFLELSLFENERLFAVLKNCRNVAVHDFRARTDLGWCMLVPSTILRVIELSYNSEASQPTANDLEKECIESILSTLQAHSVIKEYINNSEYRNKKERDTIDRLDKITEILNQHIMSTKNVFEDEEDFDQCDIDQENNSELMENISDLASQGYEKLSTSQVRQHLLVLKSEISDFYVLKEKTLTPEQNILQAAIINDIMLHKPRTRDDWCRMSDTAWRYQKNKHIMDEQLEIYWEKIHTIIDRRLEN